MSTRNSDEESEYFSEDEDATRSNHWTGQINTWKSMTRDERGYDASLTQLRNQDLSVHLYNAHALKRRARELRIGVRKEEFADLETFEGKQDFEPPKSWTAWPLPPDEVPRDGESVGPDDPLEPFTLKRREIERPSRELEEILMGTTLRYAKQRFESRELADKEREEGPDLNEVVSDISIGFVGQAGSDEDITENPSGSSDSDIKNQPKQSTESNYLKPVISADDERSREILRPSIRHTLSKLDEVLLALHHARETFQLNAAQSKSDTEDDSRVPSEYQFGGQSVVKRSRGRPRKHAPLSSRPKDSQPEHQELDAEYARLLPAKKSHLGRPTVSIEHLEGETDKEYLVRVARIRKQPLPPFAPPITKEYPVEDKTPQPRIRRVSSEDLAKRRKRILGLRDWSEVLGSAALVGFSPDVIARATQRCATMFGEGMITQSLTEGPAIAENLDITTLYHPKAIPNFEEDEDESASESNASSDYNPESEYDENQSRYPNHRPEELPSIEDPYSCPFLKCFVYWGSSNGIFDTDSIYLKSPWCGCYSQTRAIAVNAPSLDVMEDLVKDRPTVQQILAHPAYPEVIWDLEPTKRGRLDVAEGRGGPFKIDWEVHGRGEIKLVVGMGKSDVPLMRYSTSEMAKDLLELIDYLGWTEDRELHVMGVSMGGMIAQELKAVLIPTRICSLNLLSTAAVIENTTTFVENLRTRINMFIPKSLDRSTLDASRSLFSDSWLSKPDDVILPTSSTPKCTIPPSGYKAFATNYERFAAQELNKRLNTSEFTRKGVYAASHSCGVASKDPK
ncbi:hypothetical protein B7494_g850 [Chlorociboria aeruginascens]|nr:hypothetical protein B7494_g850 [Chlorociboria aeruginascens]